jgi:hypothetical protein
MRFAGFTIHECESIRDLRQQLISSTDIEAVIMVEDIVSIPADALMAAKDYFHGPLILFEGRYTHGNKGFFDVTVPNLTLPSEWLPQLQAVISELRFMREDEAFREN